MDNEPLQPRYPNVHRIYGIGKETHIDSFEEYVKGAASLSERTTYIWHRQRDYIDSFEEYVKGAASLSERTP